MKNSTNMYFLGEAERRRSAVARAAAPEAAGSTAVLVCTNAAGLEAAVMPADTSDPSAACHGGNASSSGSILTAESGIFPCLFPHGEGFNTGAMRMLDYIKLRWQQLFSPFSLLKTYALVMAQVIAKHPLQTCSHRPCQTPISGVHTWQMIAPGSSADGVGVICMQFQLFEKRDYHHVLCCAL